MFLDVRDSLTRLEDKKNQRLEVLRRYSKHTYDAVMWLRENQDKFEHPVHEPVMLVVSVIGSFTGVGSSLVVVVVMVISRWW